VGNVVSLVKSFTTAANSVVVLGAVLGLGCGSFEQDVRPGVAPYPPSEVIERIIWDFGGVVRKAPGSDLWPTTWARDGNLYTSWGDGGGFGGTNSDGRVSLGFARIGGPPSGFTAKNVWGGKNPENPATFGGKTGTMLSVDGVLYAVGGVWPGAAGVSTWASSKESRLIWSSDLGKAWRTASWTFADKADPTFVPESFVNFGQDYAGARDGFVYLYGGTAWWERSSEKVYVKKKQYLARVPKDKITNRGAYEFFKGLDHDGNPTWTAEIAERRAVFVNPNGIAAFSVYFNPGIKRYLALTAHGQWETSIGRLGVFDAPEPWGPWTTVEYNQNWGGFTGAQNGYHIVTKTPDWMSPDGKTIHVIFSGQGELDSFNLVKATLALKKPAKTHTRA
jgi:hypothetical protein